VGNSDIWFIVLSAAISVVPDILIDGFSKCGGSPWRLSRDRVHEAEQDWRIWTAFRLFMSLPVFEL
jgi:hypothetical protein